MNSIFSMYVRTSVYVFLIAIFLNIKMQPPAIPTTLQLFTQRNSTTYSATVFALHVDRPGISSRTVQRGCCADSLVPATCRVSAAMHSRSGSLPPVPCSSTSRTLRNLHCHTCSPSVSSCATTRSSWMPRHDATSNSSSH